MKLINMKIYTMKLFKRYLGTYLLVLIIPIIILGLYYYATTAKIVSENVENSTLININQMMNNFEGQIEEIDQMINMIGTLSEVSEFLRIEDINSGKSVNQKRQLIFKLRPYISINQFVNDFFIYSKKE